MSHLKDESGSFKSGDFAFSFQRRLNRQTAKSFGQLGETERLGVFRYQRATSKGLADSLVLKTPRKLTGISKRAVSQTSVF